MYFHPSASVCLNVVILAVIPTIRKLLKTLITIKSSTLGFAGSSESKLAALWLEGLLDLPPDLPLAFVRSGSLLPLAGQPRYRAPGPSPLAGTLPDCCRFRLRF